MAEVIRMPRLSDTMEEGNIIGWLKKVGDQVIPGDILAEVETDKATMELENFYSGTLLYIGIPEGPVAVDGVIAIIGDPKKDDVDKILAGVETAAPVAKEETPAETIAPLPSSPAPATKPTPAPAVIASVPENNGRIKASPLAKKMASDAGISIQYVTGSGDHGRIIKKDIEQYIANGSPTHQASAANMPTAIIAENTEVTYGDQPVSQMRKVIAKRLSQSKFGAPHFYLTMEINMDEAIKARKVMNAEEGVKISFNDLVVKASATALRKNPMINASWFGDKITIHQDINIGVAVAVEDGLVVPVIKNTDLKSLSMINAEVKSLAGKARSKKIQPLEMTGNTFTISNLGMFGITEFTAIINPPDACILAVGAIIQKPIVKDGQLAVGNTMKVTLSCDHRIVDGAKGSEFLKTLRNLLENPVKILV